MAERDRTLTAAENAELMEYITAARDRHIRSEGGIIQNYATVILDEDVHIRAFDALVHAGGYHMRIPDGPTVEDANMYLWTLDHDTMTPKMIGDMIRGTYEKSEGEPRQIKVRMELHRVNLAEGRPLRYEELLAWIAIADAESEGDKDRARRIFELTYKGSVEEITDRPVTIRSGADFSQFIRGATKRAKTKGIVLKNRNGKEVTRITAIEDFLELKPSGRKTMVKLNQEATKLSQSGEYRHDGETVCRVVLGVAETAEQYGITEASARKRLRRDFRTIANESITVKQGKSWATIPVAGGAFGIRGDNAFFTLSPDFMKIMLGPKMPQLDLPPEIYGTDDANYPAALQIGFKLYNHDNMNYGRPNQNRITLTALLHAATELPKAGTVNRHETEKIMGPFEATMDHLVAKGVLADWDYCHENGEPLTDEELETIQTEHELGKPTPWAMAEGLLVTWDLGRRYADNEDARQASRDRRRTAALEAKAEREKEAKAKERRIRGKVENIIAKKRAEDEAER